MGADIGVSPEPGVSLGCEQEFSLVGDDGDAFGGECVFIREFFPARGAEVEPLGGVYVYAVLGLHDSALVEHFDRYGLFGRTYAVRQDEADLVRPAGQRLIEDLAGRIGLERESVCGVVVPAVNDKIAVAAGDLGLHGEFPVKVFLSCRQSNRGLLFQFDRGILIHSQHFDRCGVDAVCIDPVLHLVSVCRSHIDPEAEWLLSRFSGLGCDFKVQHLRGELLVDDLVGNLLFGLPLQGHSVDGRHGLTAVARGI